MEVLLPKVYKEVLDEFEIIPSSTNTKLGRRPKTKFPRVKT